MGMNSFELIPTEENLIHTLDKDLLKRNKDLVRFYDLILVQEGASSIAIDSNNSVRAALACSLLSRG